MVEKIKVRGKTDRQIEGIWIGIRIIINHIGLDLEDRIKINFMFREEISIITLVGDLGQMSDG